MESSYDAVEMSRIVSIALTALLACGCHATSPPATMPAATLPNAATSTFSRIKSCYPLLIGKFMRVNFTQYDRAGEDASVGYNLFNDDLETAIAFTAYFYPFPSDDKTFDRHFEHCLAEVHAKHENSQRGQTRDVQIVRNGITHQGRTTEFTYQEPFGGLGEIKPVVSQVWLFEDQQRVVLYRITFDPSDEPSTKQLESFLDAFPWPPQS